MPIVRKCQIGNFIASVVDFETPFDTLQTVHLTKCYFRFGRKIFVVVYLSDI